MYRITRSVLLIAAMLVVASVPTSHSVALVANVQAQSVGEPSFPGGIGDTRADVFRAWAPFQQFGQELVIERNQNLNFNIADGQTQLFTRFYLQADEKPRDSDRMISVSDGFIDAVDIEFAETFAQLHLPKDATNLRSGGNNIGERVEIYTSRSVLRLFPELHPSGDDQKGTGEIWVTFGDGGLGEGKVFGIDMSLWDVEL